MRYGYFDDPAREYIITNPRTPVNGSIMSERSRLAGFWITPADPSFARAIPRSTASQIHSQLPAGEFRGETAYARCADRGAPANSAEVLAPYWVPCLDPYDKFECHVGMYYTRWITEMRGLRFEVLAFIPRDEEVLVRQYRVTNLREEPVAVEWCPLWNFSHLTRSSS